MRKSWELVGGEEVREERWGWELTGGLGELRVGGDEIWLGYCLMYVLTFRRHCR